MRLAGKLVNVSDVTAARRDEMFTLMDEHYANVRRELFESDLASKQWVICIFDPVSDRLCGFSTQTLLDAEVEGRPVKALFSGDTIIHRERWGDHALSHVWGRLALSIIDAQPGEELYWFLISKGYKTYRFLPVFFHKFFPRHDMPTPPRMKAVMDALALSRWPTEYDAPTGIIRATPSQYRLCEGLADVTPERLTDPHVRFFQAKNSGHIRGDELCCLAPLTRENFTPAAYRVIGPESAARGAS